MRARCGVSGSPASSHLPLTLPAMRLAQELRSRKIAAASPLPQGERGRRRLLWMMKTRTRFRKPSCRSLVGSRREWTMADDYTIERTRSGFQYLIPGTERRTLPKCAKPEHSREGDQYVIPGAEPITTRELLSRLAGKPIRPR